jgi:hypothetical protein
VLKNGMLRRIYWNKEEESYRRMETITLREGT